MSQSLDGGLDLAAATGVISRHLGAPVALEPTSGPRGRHHSAVVRCRVQAAIPTAPSTVIVKQAPAGHDGRNMALFNEWAALAFLPQLGLDPPVSPALYGGDAQARLLVLEDLGDGDSLVDALLGSDEAKAEAALLALASALGRMHAASIARCEEHHRMREALGPFGGEAIIHAAALAGRFEDALRTTGLRVGDAADDLERVIARIAAPGPFLALVHGDAGPGNERLDGENLVLLDFGTAGLRHALLDGVCGRVAFPTRWCARRLPPRIADSMEESYREELARECRAAVDDQLFTRAAATACAYWLIETTTVALASLPSGDSVWGTSTIGERLALRAELFAELADAAGEYRGLAALLSRLVETLALTDASMPLYPAFGGPELPAGPHS